MADAEPDPAPIRPLPTPSARELLERLALDRRRAAGLLAAMALVVGAALAGYALLRTPPAPAAEAALPFAGSGSGSTAATAPGAVTTSTSAVPTSIVVHAAGAVAVPGLHELPVGSRVADVLAAAGGPAADADLDRVNLAAPVADGERVWFPRVGEDAPPVVAGGAVAAPGSTEPAGPVDLNSATAEQLDALPGVGPATAAAIIQHREQVGRFTSIDDLLDVPGIGDAKLAQLRDLVTV